MAYKYCFTERARNDLDGIVGYIKYQLVNDGAAKELLARLEEKINVICDYLIGFPEVMKTADHNNCVRKATVKRYNVYYVVDEPQEMVVILSIRHFLKNENKFWE